MKIKMLCLTSAFVIIFYAKASSLPLLEAKIVEGEPVEEGTMKFMASLRINLIHFCGGSLISKMFILTAGQCINIIFNMGGGNFVNATALLGTISLSGPGIEADVIDVDHHEQFSPTCPEQTSPFDVGLILLGGAVIDRNLEGVEYSPLLLTDNVIGYVVGWGSEMKLDEISSDTLVQYSPFLKQMGVTILNDNLCEFLYENTVFSTLKQACGLAWRGGEISLGDLGNPLVWEGKILGITQNLVSSRPHPHMYAPFIKVSEIRDYIDRAKFRMITKNRGLYPHVETHSDIGTDCP